MRPGLCIPQTASPCAALVLPSINDSFELQTVFREDGGIHGILGSCLKGKLVSKIHGPDPGETWAELEKVNARKWAGG